jgi:hypothetical protein
MLEKVNSLQRKMHNITNNKERKYKKQQRKEKREKKTKKKEKELHEDSIEPTHHNQFQ